MKLSIITFILLLMTMSCTEQNTFIEPQDTAEIERQVNWAVVELNNLSAAMKYYRSQTGNYPAAVTDLYPYLVFLSSDPDTAAAYLVEYTPVHRWWEFGLRSIEDQPVELFCVSREVMVDGAGHRISYDLTNASYSGYGMEYVNSDLYPLLLECYLDPRFVLLPDGEYSPEQAQQNYLTIRQVNWAAISLMTIRNGAIMYIQDYGEDPRDVDELLYLEYIYFSETVHLWWNFSFNTGDIISSINAVSTGQMTGTAGDSLTYNVGTGKFEGEWSRYLSPWIEAALLEVPVYIQYLGGLRGGG